MENSTTNGTIAPAPKEPCTYEPINLHNQAESDELLRQRILCGWANTPRNIEVWRKAIDKGEVVLFWIVPRHLTSSPALQRFAGHIGLENECQPPEHDIARPDKSLIEISTLFVLKEYRHLGLGRTAMRDMERYAQQEPYGSPNCKAVTIHTMSRRYWEDDGDDWRGIYARIDSNARPPAKGTSNEDWYARMGYVKFKEEPRYPTKLLDGTDWKFTAVFMRKELA
jgi:ribosomal protein S18 acetylase RimI-like enzyme